MRYVLLIKTLIFAGLLALPALAQPPEPPSEGDGPPRRQPRERILRAFDKDGDGRLNDEERDAMREQMGDRFEAMRERMRDLFEERRADRDRERAGRDAGRRPDGDRRPDADREGGRDGEARRGPRGERRGVADGERGVEPRRRVDVERRVERRRGPDGPRGPIGPMGGPPDRNLQGLFAWFDQDGDNMLNRREFAELSQFVERRRPGPPGGPPGGPRFGRRDSGDRPRGGGGDFRRLRGRFDGPPRGEDRPGRLEGERRRPDDRRGPDERRSREERRGDAPRPPRPDNPPNPPASPDGNPADPV